MADLTREQIEETLERANNAEKAVRHMADVKGRLELQRQALRLIVAESLKDYHEQFKMILNNKEMQVSKIGPELLDLNRESLKLQLDISKVKLQTDAEQKATETRVSERLKARLSENSMSPENRTAPKTVNTRSAPSSNRLQSDEGRSTQLSTQRPTQRPADSRLLQNAVMSP